MSDRRHRRAPATLPESYRFGEQTRYVFGDFYGITCYSCFTDMERAPFTQSYHCHTCGRVTVVMNLSWIDLCLKERTYETLSRRG